MPGGAQDTHRGADFLGRQRVERVRQNSRRTEERS
jgi:hypothetical protein